MTTTAHSTVLEDALAAVSRAAYQSYTHIESQARTEVAHALSEAREARTDRDEAIKELHTCQLEWQKSKQELIASKASLQQAELTIAHHVETIAQLRREINQWKDQSRNWQDHFLRVEQERCALTSRMEELVTERLQWSQASMSTASFTPKSRYNDLVNSAPSSTTTKRGSIPSPSRLPAYKSAAPPSSSEVSHSESPIPPLQLTSQRAAKQAKAKPNSSLTGQGQVSPHQAAEPVHSKQENSVQPVQKAKPAVQSTSRPQPQKSQPPPRVTVIRRVEAVIRVKQEESDEDSIKNESRSEEDVPAYSSRSSRRRSRKIVEDDDEWVSEDDNHKSNVAGDVDGEQDVEDEEDDELMMGAEDNHDEVYGSYSIQPKRRPRAAAAPPTKKRKVGAKSS